MLAACLQHGIELFNRRRNVAQVGVRCARLDLRVRQRRGSVLSMGQACAVGGKRRLEGDRNLAGEPAELAQTASSAGYASTQHLGEG